MVRQNSVSAQARSPSHSLGFPWDDLDVKEGGITPDQLVVSVMKNVLGGIVSATGKAALKVGGTVGAGAADAAGGAVKKTGADIKKLFGK